MSSTPATSAGGALGDDPLEPAPDTRVGSVVQDRYRIVRPLGEGGMGVVYEGEHLLIQRRVAIKTLHAPLARDRTILKRFLNEARAATAIGHPNIVEVTDMGRFDDGTPFMVLELLDGRDLADLVEAEGPLGIGRTARILTQVCDALGAAHAKGIVHRDLKPENVFLLDRDDRPDFVKVLDFGIAKFKEGGGVALTGTGHAIGTPYYMAPEQAQGRKDVDERADLYALGVMLFHCLSAAHPFEGDSFPNLVLKVINEPHPSLRHFRPGAPEALVELTDRLLAKDRSERPATAAEVKRALRPFVTAEDEAAPPKVARAVTGDRGRAVRTTGPTLAAAPAAECGDTRRGHPGGGAGTPTGAATVSARRRGDVARDHEARGDGAREHGPQEDGAREHGPQEDGARQHGAQEDGARQHGAQEDGARQHGAPGHGARDDGASEAREERPPGDGAPDDEARGQRARDDGAREMDDALVADDGRAESDTARHGAGSHADTAPPTATGASTSHADGRLASLVALGALAVALATVVAFVLRDPGGQGPPTPSPPPAAPAPEPARTAPDEPEPPPSTPTVRIRVRTEPANAELRLDGEPVANPFDADLPQDDEPLTFEARAEGYATARRELVPRFAQRVSLALEPEVPDRPGQGRPARPSAAAGRTRGTPEPAEASPATEAVPSEADPAEAPEPDTSDEGDEEIQRIRF